MAKTNWQYGEIVTEEDFNQLGQEMNEATAGLAVLEEQIGEAEQISKAYTDQQIQLVTATGIPKLVTYSYVLAAQQDQTDFEIPLETFVKETDTVTVAQNSTVLSTERYSIIDPKTVRLAEGVNIGTEIFIQVWKNVPIGPDGAISAAVLANDTVTESKMADEMKKDIPGGVAGYDTFATHLADFTQQIPYAVTAGSANAYTASTTPALPALVAGVAIAVKIHAANTGAATLNWNGKGAKSIKNPDGMAVASGDLASGGIYTLRYDGTNFILQGKGEVKLTGNAGDAQVLNGYTYYNTDPKTKRTGTMPSNSSQTATLQITGSAKPTKVVPAGYSPGGTITAELAAALASKILSGNTIGGVAGTAVDVTVMTAGDAAFYDSGANTSQTGTTGSRNSPLKIYARTINGASGIVRVKFDFAQIYGSGTANVIIYKNGIAVGTERQKNSSSYTTFTEDIEFVSGDTIAIYGWMDSGPGTSSVKHFKLCCAIPVTTASA
ncbi:hypothetical protein [Desulfitobacterium sp. PCE1]|uniref:hypothetical protein n=1 Tax=Desulfitobacterium sp. PCE1 TaxID=146907 RepID=UPI00037362BA|nr:hypothetical protein [Desulfitobacterium sp. PCE1]